ncbi:Helix-hairpin-helix motif protein [uncultured archaeon]|nr:Helix-hairpin-helix motif protein [uncultured archaeon]
MIKRLMIFLIAVALISNAFALCNSTQININTADLTALQEITQIGPARAQSIIELRPFGSVDDLARVSGIGNGTRLNQIKSQGLACVDEDEETNDENTTEIKENETIEDNYTNTDKDTEASENIPHTTSMPSSNAKNSEKAVELPAITLNADTEDAKSIKSEDNKEILKKNLSFYGIITFCVMFGILFLIGRRKNKNEFK